MIKSIIHLKTTVSLASAIASLTLGIPAMADTTVSDNFDTAHDYVADGVTGTIWDGIVNAGSAVTLNSSTTTSGQLRIAAANAVGWDSGYYNAPFLYLNVSGDFDARVQVTAMTTGNYNVGALMARLGDPSADGTAGEDLMMVASNKFGSLWIQGRSVDDTTKLDSNGPSGLAYPRWLRLTRTENTFNIYYGTDGATWTGVDWGGVLSSNIGLNLVRNDLDGLPLQVGLWQGSFTSSGQTADFDNFSITIIPEPSAGLLALGAAGLVLRRSRRMTR
jgi:regulation of enolase protein 1 (concanavalin A-like superfamily)